MKKNRPKIIKRKKKTPFAKSKVPVEITQDPKTFEEKLGSEWYVASVAASLVRMQLPAGTNLPSHPPSLSRPLTHPRSRGLGQSRVTGRKNGTRQSITRIITRLQGSCITRTKAMADTNRRESLSMRNG